MPGVSGALAGFSVVLSANLVFSVCFTILFPGLYQYHMLISVVHFGGVTLMQI